MNGLFQKVVPLTMAMALAMFQPSAHAAAKCKGLSKSSCTGNSDCSWVAGYATKAGKKVDAYCRVKSGKKKSSAQMSEKQKQSKKQEGKKSKDQDKKQSKKQEGKKSKDQDKKQTKKEKKSSQNAKEKKAKESSKKQE